jgi:hypothetical protein
MKRITIPLTDEQLEAIYLAASLRFKDEKPSPKVLAVLFYEFCRQFVDWSKQEDTPWTHIRVARPETEKHVEFITDLNVLKGGCYLGMDKETGKHIFEERPDSGTIDNVKYWRYFRPPVEMKQERR